MKIHRLHLYQEFNAPVEQIWEAFNDHESFGRMMGQKMSRVVDSPDPNNINGVNSTRKLHVPLIPFEETIRKSVRPNRIEYQISKGSPLAHHYGVMEFKSLPGGKSALDYTIEMGSSVPGWAAFVAWVIKMVIGGNLRKYSRGLKN